MSLVNTRIQNVRATSNLDKNELRPGRYGALDLFMQQSNDPAGVLTPELKAKAVGSIGNVLETPVIDFDGEITIGNTRSVTISDSENTSKMLQITFATYAWGFTMVPALFMNNEISMQADFDRKFKKYLYQFGDTMDTVAIAALSSAKTQIVADALNYAVAANTIAATYKQRENLIGDINPMMAANKFIGEMHLLGNAGIESIIGKLKQEGQWNDKNKQLEYSDKILHYTTNISNAAGIYATGYAVTGGMLGILTRFERESLLGTISRDGHEWGIDTLPMLNFPIGTYYYDSVGDFSALGGAATADMTRVRKEHYGFAVDVAFITAYNSDPTTLASPIMKLTIASEGVADQLQVNIVNTIENPVNTLAAI